MSRLAICLALLATLSAGSSSALVSQGADEPEAVIRQLFLAIYSNDAATYNRITTEHPQRGLLTTGGSVNSAALRRLEEDPEGLQVREMRPVLHQGKPVESAGKAPVGATGLYMAAHQGGPMVVPVVRRADGWKVDVRWWIAAAEMARSNVTPDPAHVAVRSLLSAMLRLDRSRAARYITRAENLDALFAGAPRQREPSGVLDAAVEEMPLVEIASGEFQPMPTGRIVEGGSTADRKVLVGMFGPIGMAFVVHRSGNVWRVDVEPYFLLMMQ